MGRDYVIVGSGLTGAVIARKLADYGKDVIVVERRNRLGGNVADAVHPSGVNVHIYGPHLFRTTSEDVWKFVTRFAEFHTYCYQVKVEVDGGLENWPIAASYINLVCGENWSPALQIDESRNFEEAALCMMPRVIYKTFVKEYTEKQWGAPAETLLASLCKRFSIRHDDNPYLTPDALYQGIPTKGFSHLMNRILEGIPVVLNCDYLENRQRFEHHKQLIFSGPIDEYFDYKLGKLTYRGQRRKTTYIADVDWRLPCGVVNASGHKNHIRTIEWKHLMRPDYANQIRGTVLTQETPYSPENPDDYEYPFPNKDNLTLYRRYLDLAKEESGLLLCGRLGEYRYYDMDHAIIRAMKLADQILQKF
ncbi:NAD(P)-binding protein [Candidatus Pacearchaeota archaeon]|nr:NAD(P)-binding protein [Candidatus Pacearchaeota archaeon]